MKEQSFDTWLREQMQIHGLNNVGLALKIKTSDSTVGYWVRGLRKPDKDSCIKLAQVFNIPVEEILIRAGRIVDLPKLEPDFRTHQVLHLFGQLPPHRQEEALAILRVLVDGTERAAFSNVAEEPNSYEDQEEVGEK